jgi:hypothetical protein
MPALPSPHAFPTAKRALAYIVDERFADARALFSDELRARLPSSRLASTYGDTLRQLGGVQFVALPSSRRVATNDVVTFRHDGELCDYDIEIVVGAQPSITGIWFRRAAANLTSEDCEAIDRQAKWAWAFALAAATVTAAIAWGITALVGSHLVAEGFGIGAMGWSIALALRIPLAAPFAAWFTTTERRRWWSIAMSGLCEEPVRALAVHHAQAQLAAVLSIGVGWAAVELLHIVISAQLDLAFARRGSLGGERLRKLLDQAHGRGSDAVLWGGIARASAICYHVAAGVWLARSIAMLPAVVVLHCGFNAGVSALSRKSRFATACAEVLLSCLLVATIAVFATR